MIVPPNLPERVETRDMPEVRAAFDRLVHLESPDIGNLHSDTVSDMRVIQIAFDKFTRTELADAENGTATGLVQEIVPDDFDNVAEVGKFPTISDEEKRRLTECIRNNYRPK